MMDPENRVFWQDIRHIVYLGFFQTDIPFANAWHGCYAYKLLSAVSCKTNNNLDKKKER